VNASPSVIVFDLGNVLIPVDPEQTVRRLNERQAGLGDLVKRLIVENPEWQKNLEVGAWSKERFLEEIVPRLDGALTGEEVCEYYSEIFELNDDVIALLPKLKKNYSVFLLSNTNEIHQKYGWEKYDFIKRFDEVILSNEAGSAKPDAAIYREAEKRSGKPSAEHLFIDDLIENVEGAKRVGWDAILFRGYDDLTAEFRARGVKFE
jgi:putative hydrolase of the HAD superfamily